MSRRVRVVLGDGDRRFLESMVSSGEHKARAIARARVLLMLDEPDGVSPLSRAEIADRCGVSVETVRRVAGQWRDTHDVRAVT
ncbi:helix-turn-helix domain-containing protein, partial [Bifidobacterium amazonense]